ncbi:leukocyte receptor cluster member 1 homolog [Drosophila eugracilis]|uniref:leukocyte receptor cluster member 1 homolog n=1 Tax=Drosophila eugracilis TaxID=29029 RepID=UPI0007E5FB21|nr:leukocyte receptor cluster member 1 homolog [Drosophila eugracilis]
MNILPKKRWHVRTKENIARVRRDQAAAAAEEKIRKDKLEFAESEARINFLRRQSGLPEKVSVPKETQELECSTEPSKGVDLFADYRSHVKTTNKDLEKEQKEEQEKYEKQIGYLTYLGQDTNEALKVRSWYEVAPKRPEVGDQEAHLKQKLAHDPLALINALLPPEKKDNKKTIKKKREGTPTPPPEPATSHKPKKHKKDKKHSKHKNHKDHKSKKDYKESLLTADRQKREKLEKMRRERLRRETSERQRSDALFAPKEPAMTASAASTPAPTPRIVQKYNSQFNPELAKQNML